MSSSRARAAGLLVVLVAAFGAVHLARGEAPLDEIADALLPDSVASGAALAEGVPAEPAPPPKPRRQIVPDVEVVVNIPSGRLELMAGDSLVRSYPISVGSARYPTPVGDFLLATVIWNPWWRPPPESDWARNRKPEPPGPGNPMGRVKLHMDELIYIHGTSSEGRLGAPASHGCIRMSNADVVDLAKRLHRIAAPGVTDEELERLSTAGRQERHTVMARSIRMRVTYQVARVLGERLHVYPDVYGKTAGGYTAVVKRELARAGMDTVQVPSAALARLRASGGARGGASFALADVPSLRPLPPAPPAPPRETGPRLLGRPVTPSAEPVGADADVPEPAVSAPVEAPVDASADEP